MSNSPFDPHSTNAMFASILTRLDEQSRSAELRERVIRERLDQQERTIRDSLLHEQSAAATYRQEIKDKLSDIKTETAEIKIEVKKTNGRVTWIEKWIANFKGKQAVVMFVGSAVATVVWWAIQRYWQ